MVQQWWSSETRYVCFSQLHFYWNQWTKLKTFIFMHFQGSFTLFFLECRDHLHFVLSTSTMLICSYLHFFFSFNFMFSLFIFVYILQWSFAFSFLSLVVKFSISIFQHFHLFFFLYLLTLFTSIIHISFFYDFSQTMVSGIKLEVMYSHQVLLWFFSDNACWH